MPRLTAALDDAIEYEFAFFGAIGFALKALNHDFAGGTQLCDQCSQALIAASRREYRVRRVVRRELSELAQVD